MPLTFLSPVHKALRQIEVHLGEALADTGLSTREGHLLAYLRSYAPCPLAEIHRVFGHRRSTLTSLLDRLEDRGLLLREVDSGDRRSFLVRLTPRGRKVAGATQVPVRHLEAAIRRRVNDRDVRGFRRVMEAIALATDVQLRTSQLGTREKS